MKRCEASSWSAPPPSSEQPGAAPAGSRASRRSWPRPHWPTRSPAPPGRRWPAARLVTSPAPGQQWRPRRDETGGTRSPTARVPLSRACKTRACKAGSRWCGRSIHGEGHCAQSSGASTPRPGLEPTPRKPSWPAASPPHTQAGHMDATDPIQNLHPNTCKQGAVHIRVLVAARLLAAPARGISQDRLPLYLGFFQSVRNARRRGKALLGARRRPGGVVNFAFSRTQ